MMIEKQVLKRFFPRSVPLTVERSAEKERPGSVLPFRDSDINLDRVMKSTLIMTAMKSLAMTVMRSNIIVNRYREF